MVINIHRYRRMRADRTGRTWAVGHYRRDVKAGRTYRCFLNGKDVTNQTFYVDSRRGIVRMYLHGEDGRPYYDESTGEAAKVERRGHVQLRRRA